MSTSLLAARRRRSLLRLLDSPFFLFLLFTFSLKKKLGHQGDRQGRPEGRPPRQHGREAQGAHGRGEEERFN